ncbi:hypothetical protein MZM54_00410 [[Brevibacterium] frigoritolerans]|nr:hypothetical protein [Peribacillus frigoritolerans]
MVKKKWFFILAAILVIVFIGSIIFTKLNPPLVSSTVATTSGNDAVVIGIGNKGFSKIRIKGLLVNNNEIPSYQKIQASNPLKGFALTDNFDTEAKEYGLKNIEDVIIETDTSPTEQYEKMDKGTATKNDKIYGISIVHTEPIHVVHIKYSYFWLKFEETVPVKNNN